MASPTPPLRKVQRNDIIQAIEAVGLDPAEFLLEKHDHWSALPGHPEVRIRHRSSDSCFSISDGNYVVGDDLRFQYGRGFQYGSAEWQVVMRHVRTWLNGVKLDLETPDLWAELQNQAKLLDFEPGDAAENTPFTREEQEEIARRLQELAEDAKSTYSLSEAQMRALNEKINYLVDAAGRLGRTDWRGVLIGTMLSFGLSAALPADPARHIFFSILRVLGRRYGFPELGG